jgi:hypothetical protein
MSFNSVDLYFIKIFPQKIENILFHFSMYYSRHGILANIF